MTVFTGTVSIRRLLAASTTAIAATVLLPAPAHAAPSDLDTSFGDEGIAATRLGDGGGAADMVAQPDGKLVVAGRAENRLDIGVERHNPDGTFDRTFGSGGWRRSPSAPGPPVDGPSRSSRTASSSWVVKRAAATSSCA